mmetsp:Transcript_10188/g.25407  ORF Transcript_10188/g.25407 Transcript_10188/m.25407 type:complete len:245 (-) Transcript_10188:85-819(-)
MHRAPAGGVEHRARPLQLPFQRLAQVLAARLGGLQPVARQHDPLVVPVVEAIVVQQRARFCLASTIRFDAIDHLCTVPLALPQHLHLQPDVRVEQRGLTRLGLALLARLLEQQIEQLLHLRVRLGRQQLATGAVVQWACVAQAVHGYTVLPAEHGQRVAALHAHQNRRAQLHHTTLSRGEGVDAPARPIAGLQHRHDVALLLQLERSGDARKASADDQDGGGVARLFARGHVGLEPRALPAAEL